MEKREPSCIGGKCKLIQPLWKMVWRVLKKKKEIKPPYDPVIPIPGIYPEETEKDTRTPMFTTVLFTVARTRKQPRCPLTNE